MNRRFSIAFLLAFMSASSFAQHPAKEDIGYVYRSEAAGGLMIHTRGWGGTFRYGIQKSYTVKTSFGLDFVGMKSPKEVKVYNPAFDEGKGYYFGKLNSLLIMRPSFGQRRVLFQKVRTQGVEVGFNWAVGPSFCFAKPVYLEILVPVDPQGHDYIPVEMRYDPTQHTADNILGRAPFTRGLNETKIYPGGFAKFGMHFEYSPEEDGIKALEVGAILDVYPVPVPQLAYNNPNSYFLTLYVNLLFGRKYF